MPVGSSPLLPMPYPPPYDTLADFQDAQDKPATSLKWSDRTALPHTIAVGRHLNFLCLFASPAS